MKNSEKNLSALDKMHSCQKLIQMIEAEEAQLRKKLLAKRRVTYMGRHKNLIGYMEFFKDNELKKEAAALEFDLLINEKAIGKRLLKGEIAS